MHHLRGYAALSFPPAGQCIPSGYSRVNARGRTSRTMATLSEQYHTSTRNCCIRSWYKCSRQMGASARCEQARDVSKVNERRLRGETSSDRQERTRQTNTTHLVKQTAQSLSHKQSKSLSHKQSKSLSHKQSKTLSHKQSRQKR